MVAHRNDKTGMNERGALMIEAIALLGLMTMMSPMVVRQTADRTSEMEEVAIAGQIKELKDALSNWITSNYASEANTLNGSHTAVNKKSISASDLAPYLSSSMIDGANFRGNKLIDNYKLGVRQVCIEKQDTTSPTYATSPCNGADCGLSATIKCSRYKMTGVVLSDSGSQEIDDRRATRIASMVGADGGYMRTSKVSTALSVDKKKLLGTQGIWEGDVSDYFDDASVNTDVGGRVAATTVYAEGFAGDYLYRKPNSMPGANSMFTTLDMGGANENCDNGTNGACHQIKNAGGLEVVGGKIIIRSQNTGAGNDLTLNDTTDKIRLAADKVLMNVSTDITLQGSTGGKLWLAADRAHLYKGDGSVKIDGSQSFMSYGESKFVATNGTVTMRSNDSNRLAINNSGTTLNTGNINTSASGYINTVAGSYINMTAGTDINADAQNMALNAATQATIHGGASTLTMNDNLAQLNAGTSSSLKMTTNANLTASDKIYVNATNLVNLSSGPYLIELGKTNGTRARIGYFDGSGTAESQATFVPGQAKVGTTDSSGSTAVLNMASSSTPQIQLQTNIGNSNLGLFTLNPTTLNVELSGPNPAMELIAMTDTPRFRFHSEDLRISVFGDTSQKDTRGKAIRIANVEGDGKLIAGEGNSPIAFYPDSGRISGSFFQPEGKILNGDNTWVGIVQQRAKLAINNLEESGRMKSSIADISGGSNASVIIDAEARNGGPAPYNVHRKDTDYDRFRVDPAFISVMNDIKITSRGGARLSEALPNYILKGIYVLSNSYRAGMWPCGNDDINDGTCSFTMPYYTPADLGLTNGGEEFNCDGYTSGTHPAHSCKCGNNGAPNTSSGGCDASTKYVKFDLYTTGKAFIESDETYRWAHPFMGKVPVPGKFVRTDVVKAGESSKTPEYLYATDEGPCPDGYQAVMTVTPNAFEISRLLAVNPIYQKAFGSDEIKAYYTEFDGSNFTNVAANGSNYNYGYLPFNNDTNRTATSIIQGGSRVGIVAEKYDNSTYGEGWKVAMGTITPTTIDTDPTSPTFNKQGYIWNFGGIPADSWSAIAHTYCYFNPDRFTMPNMTFIKTDGTPVNTNNTDDVLITPMDNPLLENGYMD